MGFRFKVRGRSVRRTPGEMNKTEALYALSLVAEKSAGTIAEFWFEAMTFKLAPDTRYTPDFMVMLPDGLIEFREVKGFMEDDAWVKIKVAAEKFPFAFSLIRKRAKKDGGGWDVKQVQA